MFNFAVFKNKTEIKPCICYLSEPLLEVGKRYIHRCATRICSVMGQMWLSVLAIEQRAGTPFLCLKLLTVQKLKRMKKNNLNAVVPGSQVAAEWSSLKDENFVTFQVKGDSMDDGTADSYKDGEVLICKQIEGDIQVNRDYVIARGNDVMVRRVVAHSVTGKTIAVHSLNPIYKDETVSLADVEVYNVVISQRQR